MCGVRNVESKTKLMADSRFFFFFFFPHARTTSYDFFSLHTIVLHTCVQEVTQGETAGNTEGM